MTGEWMVNVIFGEKKIEVSFNVDDEIFDNCKTEEESEQIIINEIRNRECEIITKAAKQLGCLEINGYIDYSSISN